MAQVVKTTFKLRRSLLSTWQEKNPILEKGEPGWALDEKILKIGDGEKTWNELPEIKDTKIIEEQLKTLPGFISANGKGNEIFNSYDTNSVTINDITKNYPSNAHVEGSNNKVSGASSHAEGDQTQASGPCSHTEGLGTFAHGYASHVQNSRNEAHGYGSSANGYYTKAYGAGNFVVGMYNEIDEENKALGTQAGWPSGGPAKNRGKHAFVVGNGENEANRSNAFTVDWDGNINASGNIRAKNGMFEESITSNSGYFANISANNSLTAQNIYLDDASSRELCNYGSMISAVEKLQANPVGHNIKVIKPTEAGSIVLQENTYYQFLGSSTKKKLHFYNTDNSIGKTLEFQVLTIYCGSMTDMAEIGVVENMSPAYLMVIGNDTGLSALSGAEVGAYAFKKYLPNSTEINPTFRAEVEYPADSIIVIQQTN